MITWRDRNAFNIYLIDLLSRYGNIESSDNLERISYELHTSIEWVISDMLACGIFGNIKPDDYDAQF